MLSKLTILTAALVSALDSNQSQANSITFDLKTEYETWASGLGGQASAVLYGLGVSYYSKDYLIGTGLGHGNYDIDGSADIELTRTDYDLIIGYRIQKPVVIFTGYRFNQIKYNSSQQFSNNFKENTHGLGIGISYHQKIYSNWSGFVSSAFSVLYTKSKYEIAIKDDSGGGVSLGTEAGTYYRINNKTNVSIRVKHQTSRLYYDPNVWPHAYWRIGLNLSYFY